MILRTLLALSVLSASVGAGAQSSGGEFAITKAVIGGGGGESSGGSFRLRGTVAQPVAGDTATGGDFALRGGFWTALQARPDPVFSDGFEQ